MSKIGELGMQLGGAVLGAGLGMLGNKKQHSNQKELMDKQYQNQRELNQQGNDLAYDMWKKTNYAAQKEQMQEAGLNVGLMYGGGGAGGGTVATGSGGGAAGGNAATPDMGLGIQGAMMKSQMDLMAAQANKAEAEAENLRGVSRDNTTADTAVKTMQAENLKIANNIGNSTLDEAIAGIKANADKAQSEARSGLVKANVDEKTQSASENKIRSEAINEAFKLTLMKSDTNLNNERARAVTQELAQEWERLSIELDKVGVSKMQNAIQEFTAKVNARLGQGNLNMRGIEAGLNATGKIFGKGADNRGDRNTTVNNY